MITNDNDNEEEIDWIGLEFRNKTYSINSGYFLRNIHNIIIKVLYYFLEICVRTRTFLTDKETISFY